MKPVDLERFWVDDELAHKDNCFSKDAPQVAMGIWDELMQMRI